MGEHLYGLDMNIWSSEEYNNPPQSSTIEVITREGEVEEAMKRAMKELFPSWIEEMKQEVLAAVKQEVLAAVKQEVQATVKQGVQDAVTPIVEGVLRGMQVCPSMVDDISKRMAHTAQPYPQNLTQPSSSCSRALHFEGKIPERLYTWKNLNDQEEFSLVVKLCDESGNIVDVGAESSQKIAVVVLPGDFKAKDNNDLTGELDQHVLKERETKPRLVVGKYEVNLNKGAAQIGDFKFTDNSRWTRSGKFKLGAKFEEKVSNGVFVREAISDAFEVRERRGEGQKKKNPTLDDEVWKLNGITKIGPYCRRLEENGIKDVRALLNLHDKNPNSLKEILQVSDTKLKGIIEHATIARSSIGALNVQNTSTAVGINAAYFTNGNQTGFINVQGVNSEASIPIGNVDPALHSISDLQYPDAIADLGFDIEEFWATNDEFRTKFSPRWVVIRAAQRVISLRIRIASRPQKKQKI